MLNTDNHRAKPVLNLSDLACVRGERRLFSQLNTQLSDGQCLHVIGANGSGKTSLLRIISGINQAEEGLVFWHNKTINNNNDFLQQTSYIGHKEGLKNELTAAENLSFYQRLVCSSSNKTTRQQTDQQIDAALAQMAILKCADLPANKLSFGQRRRLAFARLLLADFKLWILDEPFTGIDAQGRELIEGLCSKHLHKGGMIILTNHQSLHDSTLADYLVELHL